MIPSFKVLFTANQDLVSLFFSAYVAWLEHAAEKNLIAMTKRHPFLPQKVKLQKDRAFSQVMLTKCLEQRMRKKALDTVLGERMPGKEREEREQQSSRSVL